MENKSQQESLFLAAPFFMARVPLLPMENFFSLLQKENPYSYLFSRFAEDHLLREAIMIASPALYKVLAGGKNNQQTAASLFKYLNRMCSRATPFGFFSCVSLGEWGEAAATRLDLGQLHKRARPDMEWLSLVIEQLCQNPSLIPYVAVKRNPLLFQAGGRFWLQDIQEKKQREKKKNSSIRLSVLTQAIFEFTRHPILIEDLKDKLVCQHPSLEKEKLQEVIGKLLHQRFLDFELRPSLLSRSPFTDVLSKITKAACAESLLEIAAHIENYNQIAVGQGEEDLLHIQQLMGKMASSAHFLQVDLSYTGEKIVLPKGVAQQLQSATEMLWKISCITPYNPLQSYHESFLNKYGTFRTVPLLELLTEEGGLGIPECYSHSIIGKTSKDDLKGEKWDEWLQKQWTICVREKRQEIEIDEKVVDEIIEKSAKETALLSFDLLCEIISHTDQNSFFLQIEPFAWQGGATFGRFIDLLENEAEDKLRTFLQAEEKLDIGSIFVESSYHHASSSRSSNVMVHPNLRNHSIDLGGEGTIHLDEIYIGATPDRLYVTCKDGEKELRISSNNMLNPAYAPIPLRLIRDISSSKYRPLNPFSWRKMATTFFLPRIRYQNTIFSLAQWKVDLFQLTCTSKDSIDTIENAFIQWADLWQLPRYLLMSEEDNRLLLDRKHPLHLKEIALQIKKGKKVHLIEKISSLQGGQIQSQKGSHHAEFIIPFIKNKKYCPFLNKSSAIRHLPISTNSRWKLPGSEWLFVTYYLGTENENRFLIEQCHRYANSFLKRGIINGWFFVRYADPRTHLRLRFHGDPEKLLTQLVPEIHEWAKHLIHQRSIREMSFSTYEREIERYGGEELIEPTEAFFCADTQATIPLIQAILEKKTLLAEEVVATVSFIDLLKGLGLSLEEQIAFFSSLAMSTEDLAGFRQWKAPLLSLCQALLTDDLVEKEDSFFLREAFQKRASSLQTYTKKLRELEQNQRLVTSTYDIYDSILHMHHNRLMGRSGKEKKVRLYAYHTLTILAELKRVNTIYQK